MKKYFKVTFEYAEGIYCTNLAHAETAEDVEREYSKYTWRSVKEAQPWDVEEAKMKGMPIIEVEAAQQPQEAPQEAPAAEAEQQPTETENPPQAAQEAAEGTTNEQIGGKKTMKTTLKFGKIAYYGTRRENAVEIEIELRQRGGEPTFTIDPQTREKKPTGNKTPSYIELSICGDIWNRLHTDILRGGQCLDTIARYIKGNATFDKVYEIWKRYHLNGMHAGTPEQEAAIKAWKANGNRYEYKAACEELKRLGLYTVNYTGISVGRRYDNEPYTYGHGWIIQQIPGDVLIYLEHLIDTNNAMKEAR